MSSFITPIGDQDIRTTSTVKGGAPLGAYGGTPDGRIYRWGLAGGVDLAPGKVVVAPAITSNHTNIVVAAAVAVEAYTVTATLGATAATADQYAGGFLTVNDAAGEGITYLIEGNSAADASGVVTVQLAEPVKVALTTSSEVTLHVNPMANVVIAPGAVAHQAVGVPNVTVDDADYAWFQVKGYCSVLSDGVITKGAGAILSDAVNGAVEVEVAGTVTQRIGTAPEATVDTEYRTINLSLF